MGLFSIFFPRRAKIEALENLLADTAERNRVLKANVDAEEQENLRLMGQLGDAWCEVSLLKSELERHKRPRGADGKFKKGTAK